MGISVMPIPVASLVPIFMSIPVSISVMVAVVPLAQGGPSFPVAPIPVPVVSVLPGVRPVRSLLLKGLLYLFLFPHVKPVLPTVLHADSWFSWHACTAAVQLLADNLLLVYGVDGGDWRSFGLGSGAVSKWVVMCAGSVRNGLVLSGPRRTEGGKNEDC
eukprot:gene2928-biopygen3116